MLRRSHSLGLMLTFLALLLEARSLAQEQTQNNEADHDALRQLRAVAEQAINENRLELLQPHLHEDFWVVTYTDRQFSDFDTFQAQWQRTRDELLEGGSYTTQLNPERSLIFGEIALTRGNSDNVLVTGDGAEYRFPSHWSAVCRKIDGDWKIIQVHSSLNPFDNPLLEATVKDWLIKTAVGAGLAGLVLGWLTSALFIAIRRRRAKPGAAGREA